MSDLISRSELKKAIETCDKFACLPNTTLMPFYRLNEPEKNYEPYVHLRDIKNVIDNAQTVEEKSYAMGYQDGLEDGLDGIIPKGEWHHYQRTLNFNTFYITECPFCKLRVKEETNFCPNCGADMRGVKNDK